MQTFLLCGAMLYLYSCSSVKLNRLEHNDELKIILKFNPFYPFEYLIKLIPLGTVEERRNDNRSGYDGFQERNENETNENETRKTNKNQ